MVVRIHAMVSWRMAPRPGSPDVLLIRSPQLDWSATALATQAGRRCRFVQTQMVMDPAALERFQRELAVPMQLPVLAGVFLLKSAKNALFINRMVQEPASRMH